MPSNRGFVPIAGEEYGFGRDCRAARMGTRRKVLSSRIARPIERSERFASKPPKIRTRHSKTKSVSMLLLRGWSAGVVPPVAAFSESFNPSQRSRDALGCPENSSEQFLARHSSLREKRAVHWRSIHYEEKGKVRSTKKRLRMTDFAKNEKSASG